MFSEEGVMDWGHKGCRGTGFMMDNTYMYDLVMMRMTMIPIKLGLLPVLPVGVVILRPG